VSVPLPDPGVTADPSTIQAGPSQAPEQGKQKVIEQAEVIMGAELPIRGERVWVG